MPSLDVTDQTSVERTVARVLADHGSLDVLVNNAGVAGPTPPLVDYPPDDSDGSWRSTSPGRFSAPVGVSRR
jgi:NAD(P)-dependent dehydrogenase (short-subunit alcohol dehydrogenase family)